MAKMSLTVGLSIKSHIVWILSTNFIILPDIKSSSVCKLCRCHILGLGILPLAENVNFNFTAKKISYDCIFVTD